MQTPDILQKLNGVAQNPLVAMLPQIKQAKQVLSAMQNPQAYLQQAIQNNPQAMQVLSLANGDYNAAISALCKQKGINPQEFMEALKQAL